MPSNDTENIYSSPLGSGTPSTPTTAEDVSYDNDLSQLTATNVQDAIDEVAGDISDLQNAVKGIILVKINTIEVTAENDTVGSLLVKLYDALVADKNEQSSDYFHYVSTMTLSGYATLKNCGGNIRQHSSGISYNYFGARLPNQNEMDITFIEHKSPTTAIVMAKLSNAGTFTLGSVASETLTDGTKFSAIIEYYKQNE